MANVNVYLPDDLAAEARAHDIRISPLTQRAVREELQRMTVTKQEPQLTRYLDTVAEIRVDVADRYDNPITKKFRGSWIVAPDEQTTRTAEANYNAGLWFGLAVTGRGRFAVYATNRDGAGSLDDFDALDDALEALPLDIADMARAELGEIVELDI